MNKQIAPNVDNSDIIQSPIPGRVKLNDLDANNLNNNNNNTQNTIKNEDVVVIHSDTPPFLTVTENQTPLENENTIMNNKNNNLLNTSSSSITRTPTTPRRKRSMVRTPQSTPKNQRKMKPRVQLQEDGQESEISSNNKQSISKSDSQISKFPSTITLELSSPITSPNQERREKFQDMQPIPLTPPMQRTTK